MENKFCKFCGKEIPEDSIVCPKCGRQLKEVKKEEKDKDNNTNTKFYAQAWFAYVMVIFFTPLGVILLWKFHPEVKTWVKVVLTILCAILIFYAVSSSDSDNNTNSPVIEESKEKFSYEVTKEYDEYYTHYIEGTVKNNRDKDYSYVSIEFICYDKDGNNLGIAIDNTNSLLANESWKFKALGLFTNEDVDHCDCHEVDGW